MLKLYNKFKYHAFRLLLPHIPLGSGLMYAYDVFFVVTLSKLCENHEVSVDLRQPDAYVTSRITTPHNAVLLYHYIDVLLQERRNSSALEGGYILPTLCVDF